VQQQTPNRRQIHERLVGYGMALTTMNFATTTTPCIDKKKPNEEKRNS